MREGTSNRHFTAKATGWQRKRELLPAHSYLPELQPYDSLFSSSLFLVSPILSQLQNKIRDLLLPGALKVDVSSKGDRGILTCHIVLTVSCQPRFSVSKLSWHNFPHPRILPATCCPIRSGPRISPGYEAHHPSLLEQSVASRYLLVTCSWHHSPSHHGQHHPNCVI